MKPQRSEMVEDQGPKQMERFNGCWNGSPKRWDRWHIIPQLAVYTTYIITTYSPCLLGGYLLPIPPFTGTRNNHWREMGEYIYKVYDHSLLQASLYYQPKQCTINGKSNPNKYHTFALFEFDPSKIGHVMIPVLFMVLSNTLLKKT